MAEDDREPQPLRLYDLRDAPVPPVDVESLRGNWKEVSRDGDLAIGVVLRSILLAHALRDPEFRKYWTGRDGEPTEHVLKACAMLPFTFNGRKTIDERVKRLQWLAGRVKAGKVDLSRKVDLSMLTAELERQMAADLEAQFGRAEDLDWDATLAALDRMFETPAG